MEGKIIGNLLLFKKYADLYNRTYRLRHAAASRIFTFAVPGFSVKYILKFMPYTLLGILIDLPHFISTVRTCISLLYKVRVKKVLFRNASY